MARFTFDFDYWKDMAERNPAAFFRERKAIIDGFIEGRTPEKAESLRLLQDEIDFLRACAGTPMSACRTVTRMLEANVVELGVQSSKLREASLRMFEALPDDLGSDVQGAGASGTAGSG